MMWLMVVFRIFCPRTGRNAVVRVGQERGNEFDAAGSVGQWDGAAAAGDVGEGRDLSAMAIALGFLLFPVMAGAGRRSWFLWPSRSGRGATSGNLAGAATTQRLLAWAYHAFSRADLPHFAQAAFPLALLLVALPMVLRGMTRWVAVVPAWGALLVISIFAMARLNPAVVANLYPELNYRWAQVGDESLLIPQKTLDTVQSAQAALQGMKPQQSRADCALLSGALCDVEVALPDVGNVSAAGGVGGGAVGLRRGFGK